jgi:hypothetical protein
MAAASALAVAINIRDGEYWPSAILLVSLAIPLAVCGALFPRVKDPGFGATIVTLCTLGAIATQLLVYEHSPAGGWNWWSDDLTRRSPTGLFLYYGGPWFVWLLVAVAMLVRRGRAWLIAVMVLIHFGVGVWYIQASPRPRIDVFHFQQDSAQALLDGRNPYAITFDDIYRHPNFDRSVYGTGLARDGKLDFGFPYPPLSLYLSTIGYAVTHDHRYAQLAAMALAGLLIALMRPDRLSVVVAVIFLFMPRAFFILGRGWTEPFVVLMFAATVYCAIKRRKLLPVALGLLLASKQYTPLIVPLAALLVERPFRWRSYVSLIAKAVIVAAVVTLPLALLDLRGFWHSLVTVQSVAPFREDALSLLVWFSHQSGMKLGVTPAFVAALLAVAIALWRCDRGPAGFAAAVGVVYLVFVALNKQAFANYYYFVVAALWCAVAAMPPVESLELELQPETPNVR